MLSANKLNEYLSKNIKGNEISLNQLEANQLFHWRRLVIRHDHGKQSLSKDPITEFVIDGIKLSIRESISGYLLRIQDVTQEPKVDVSALITKAYKLDPTTLQPLTREEFSDWLESILKRNFQSSHLVLLKLLNKLIDDELKLDYKTIVDTDIPNSIKVTASFFNNPHRPKLHSVVFTLIFDSSDSPTLSSLYVQPWGEHQTVINTEGALQLRPSNIIQHFDLNSLFDPEDILTFFALNTDACLSHKTLGPSFKRLLEDQLAKGMGVKPNPNASGINFKNDVATLVGDSSNNTLVLRLSGSTLLASFTTLQ